MEYRVGIKNSAGEREDGGMVVGVGRLVPPSACIEFAETYQVDASAAFGEEFAAPFGEHFLFVEAHGAFGRVEHIVKVFGRIVAAANRVEKGSGSVAVSVPVSVPDGA